MKISFIGAGNVAWHLSQAFEDAGHIICEVYSRDTQKARQLVSMLYDSEIQPDLNFSESETQIIFITVSDDALKSVIERIVLPEGVIVVHTSGTRSLAELQKLLEIYSDVPVQTGVFYPLQTFTKEVPIDYKHLPICVEGTSDLVETKLTSLADSISRYVRHVDSDERFILHVAAVFASNFTNHLLSVSHDLLAREQLDFGLLIPLIRTTVEKALQSEDPAKGQTGPARRGDWITTGRHLEYLQKINPEWTDIYRLMTERIRTRHLGND
jgi:predicted short-subunit dehydrogenase-like oxidoreductase (DUF2520 family)